MKIAFYMTTVLEYGGGLEKYLIETAANMSEIPGITVDVITMDNHVTNRIIDGLSIFYLKKIDKSLSYKEDLQDIKQRLGKANYYKMQSFKALRAKLQTYDVIYSKNELIESFVFTFLVGYKHLPPIVFGGHTPIHYPNPSSFHAKLHNFLYGSLIYKFLARGVQRFHALNDYDAQRYKRLFPARQVSKIYNPFDTEKFKRLAADYNFRPEGYDPQAINILWVGRLTEQKGIDDLIKIIPAVNKRLNNKVRLAWNICGDGEQRHLVDEMAEQQPNVNYLGHVDQKYMATIYQGNQIFLSTSKWEGYPYTLIECQAFGLQVFAYNIPGVSDILKVYDGGHLVDTMDEMIQALTASSITYAKPELVPQSPASTQFEPKTIYRQLINMLKAEV